MACKYVSSVKIERVGPDITLPGFTYAESESKAVFLIPSSTHVGETPMKPGKGRLALVPNATGWQLVPTDLQTKRMEDGIALYAVEVSSDRKDAIAFIRLPGTKAGPVQTPLAAFDPSFLMSKSFVFGPSTYRMYAKKLTQTNALADGPSDSGSSIRWMGDLDGDGKLDVITDDQGSNSGGACLHLSGAAKGKDMFGPAICHIGTGC